MSTSRVDSDYILHIAITQSFFSPTGYSGTMESHQDREGMVSALKFTGSTENIWQNFRKMSEISNGINIIG